MRQRKMLIASVSVNIILALAVAILILNKYGILTRSSVGEYSYLSNPQYDAYLSTFELYDDKTDVVFAGDSITARGRFDEFFPNASLLNRGIGSDTTEGLFNRMDEILSHNPKKIFIMIGINDLGNGISQETSMEYYEKIIKMIKTESPNCEMFVESVLPTTTIDLDKIVQFNSELKALCENEGIDYIDLYSLFFDNGAIDTELISADGVHLNGKGYSKWITAINDYVER